MIRIRTIDAHTAGEPLRLIVDGFPSVEGKTMLDKREWVRANHDHLRTALMLEPRGHADMYGALFTEPERDSSDAGVLFMHNEGYSTMCGHGVIAVTTIALERGLIAPRPARRDRARFACRPGHAPAPSFAADGGPSRVTSVSFTQRALVRPARRRAGSLDGRALRADVAFGGAFYAIVDAEAVGIPIKPARLDDLRRAGMAIKHAVEAAVRVEHPLLTGSAADSTARSSPDRLTRRTPISATSRSSPTQKSIARRAAPGPAR